MIEICLGLLLIAAVAAGLAGVGGMLPGPVGFDPLPLLGYGGVAALLATGVLLVAAGATRRTIARRPGRRLALRSARLTITAVLIGCTLAVALPLAAGPFNLFRIEGLPLGYYLAAQGSLIALVILAFAWASRQNRIEAEEGGHHE